jgi:hypothetical protein
MAGPASPLGLPLHATSASWLNAVEGFFAKLTKRRLKRGIFRSVVDLQAAINRFVIEHNAEPKPFIRSQQNYPSCQTRAPSVRFHPLAVRGYFVLTLNLPLQTTFSLLP